MPNSTNQQQVDLLKTIANQEGISLDSESLDLLQGWNIQTLKKIWATGRTSDGQQILLKVLPPNSTTPDAEFVTTETRESEISNILSQSGIKASRYLKTQFDKSPKWIVREYFEGQPLGDIYYLENIHQDDLFDYLGNVRNALGNKRSDLPQGLAKKANWVGKWQNEFNERLGFVEKYLGQAEANRLARCFDKTVETDYEQAILHNDLSPRNIIKTPHGYHLIDWGEAAIGPAVIDWATVWSFAVFQKELRAKIVQKIITDNPNKDKDARIFICLATRLLATIAEHHDYRLSLENTPRHLYPYNAKALETAYQNLQELLATLNG